MKNFTIGLNIALAIAVVILFYLHFASHKNACSASVYNNNTSNNKLTPFKIAYFEMDSVQENYEFYKQVIRELNQIEQQKRNELADLRSSGISKQKEYQSKAKNMTQAELANAEQDMAQRDKEYQLAEQTKSQEFQDERFKKLGEVKKKIEEYLKDYNKDKQYSFIFVNAPELIYYKDSTYNITNDLIKGLNEEIKKKK
jgi:outer membrane protein